MWGRGQRQIEEEGLLGRRRAVDERHRLLHQAVEHPVDDEVVGPRPAPDEVREGNRRLLPGRERGEAVVADVDVGRHVERRAHPEVLVEAVVDGAVGDLAAEVDAGVALHGSVRVAVGSRNGMAMPRCHLPTAAVR